MSMGGNIASIIKAPAAWPALSEDRYLRFSVIFLLYVAQGLPIGLFQFAIPAWMAAHGSSAGDVGFVLSAGLLPWSLKLVNGFIMDRFAYLAMGRRRAWLIGAQCLIVAGLLLMTTAGLEPGDVMALALFAFAINVATTFQDVAVDGMAVDLIPDEERGRANGFMFGGQALGMGIGTMLAGLAMAQYGLFAATGILAIIVAFLLATITSVRERPGERFLPWTDGEASDHARGLHVGAWKPLFAGVFKGMTAPPTLIYMLAAFLGASSLGIFFGLAPLMGTRLLGMNEADVSALSGIGNFAGAAAGILAVGFVADRIGARKTTMLIWASIAVLALLMLLFQSAWALPTVFTAFVLIYLTQDTSMRVGCCAVAMRLCDPKIAATQFAVFMAAANLGISAGSAMLGTLDRLGGLPAMMASILLVNVAAVVLMLTARVGR
jgi:PAT family beta-lactamase induction signal transducer AmpG